MTWKTRLVMRESAFTAVAFTASVYAYYLTAFWGIQDLFIEGPLKDYMTSRSVHLELLLSGILIGGLIGVINRIIETPRLRSKPVGQVVLFRTILYLVSLSIVFSVIFLVFVTLIHSWEVLTSVFQAITPRYMWSFIIYLVLVVGAINFALEVERVVGHGNLWRLLLGSYRRPREEKRVFLFMDLKGSTTIAEELGHKRYSELLQECYRDLTKVIIRYEAAIYQYVGDEVVMSWLCTDRAERKRTSVLAFFAYKRALMSKREAYKVRFGMVPEFRGGIDVGAVTIIEVGDVKREIAYHGDVLNTAARLLELCKTRGEELVVSRAVGESVEKDTEVRASWHEEVSLRGKRKHIEAYSLQPVVKTP
jgi:adenylate cyclase